MNKINWKLRFKNKATLVTIVTTFISFVYLLLDAIHVIPSFDQESIVKAALCFIDLLSFMGIIIDPTTKGVSDSDRAMQYIEPSPGEIDEDEE